MTALEGYREELARALVARGEQGLRRHLRLPAGTDFVSNDYLGLREDPRIRHRMQEALAELDAGAGGSRLLRGHHAAFARLEERLAAWCGAEAALLFGSGYAANVGLLQALCGPDDLIVSDALNHASLIDGARLSGAGKAIYAHRDVGEVADILSRPRAGRAFVVTESLFSMDGDLAPLRELCDVAERRGALVIVDEAHATGLYGPRGSGRVEELGLRDRVLATVHTGGKALGSGGAWVAGPLELRDTLVNQARTFVFSTAPLPVLTAALHAALDVVSSEPHRREEVFRKSCLLRERLRHAGATVSADASPIVPIVTGDNAAALALQDGLFEAGFDARAIRPPTVPPGTARLRVTVRMPVPDAELARFAAEVGSRLRCWAGSI
jgi:8-amino-7-oxononanoate synthase